MSEPFLGQLMIASFNFAPKGWALANGQLLPIDQNQALFALLGTIYGGNGVQTFGLPSLQGRVPIHQGNGFTIGQSGGEETHTINTSELAAHQHPVTTQASKDEETTNRPDNAYFTKGGAYGTSADTALAATTTTATGGSQPHENHMPSLALTFVIALQGIFPSQN